MFTDEQIRLVQRYQLKMKRLNMLRAFCMAGIMASALLIIIGSGPVDLAGALLFMPCALVWLIALFVQIFLRLRVRSMESKL
jgi:hypothetical protein